MGVQGSTETLEYGMNAWPTVTHEARAAVAIWMPGLRTRLQACFLTKAGRGMARPGTTGHGGAGQGWARQGYFNISRRIYYVGIEQEEKRADHDR